MNKMTAPDKIETFPAPPTPVYVCQDDEGNSVVYMGEDTFMRMTDGPEKERWMQKLSENKVTIRELAGCVIFDVETSETTLRISDDWQVED